MLLSCPFTYEGNTNNLAATVIRALQDVHLYHPSGGGCFVISFEP